jgi:hypothetical protein
MALTDFFRINLPYGIQKNDTGEWAAFNREYKPLGWNKMMDSVDFSQYPISTKYKSLTEAKLLKLASSEEAVRRNEKGKIVKVFFYNDGTNPASNPKYWKAYFDKIKILAKLERLSND